MSLSLLWEQVTRVRLQGAPEVVYGNQEKRAIIASSGQFMHIKCMMTLDPKDIQLLTILQKNGQTSSLDLSEILGMSASQIGRRRQRLEADGLITSTPSRLDPVKLGLTVQAFIQIQTQSQDANTHGAIKRLVDAEAEIIAAWTLTGEADYIFRVYCRDLAALNRLVQDVLLPHQAIGRVHSQIVMDQVKDDTALPLPR